MPKHVNYVSVYRGEGLGSGVLWLKDPVFTLDDGKMLIQPAGAQGIYVAIAESVLPRPRTIATELRSIIVDKLMALGTKVLWPKASVIRSFYNALFPTPESCYAVQVLFYEPLPFALLKYCEEQNVVSTFDEVSVDHIFHGTSPRLGDYAI